MKTTKHSEATAALIAEGKARLMQVTSALNVVAMLPVAIVFLALACVYASESSSPVFVKETLTP